MSGEIVNLRRARKDKRRAEKDEAAAANRAQFGRTRGERELSDLERQRAAHHLDSHRREESTDTGAGAER